MASQSDKTEFRQIRDTIYTFFYYLNKPVSITEILLQFKNHKKALVEKVLDDLVTKKMIFMKLFGKSKIYCLAQEMKFEIDESIYTSEIDATQDQTEEDKILRFLKWKYELSLKQLNELKNESKELDSELSVYENQMSVDELKRAISEFKSNIKEYDSRDKTIVISTTDFNKRKKENTMLKKELSKRSTIFKEIVENLCDGLNKKKKDLLDEIGIEM